MATQKQTTTPDTKPRAWADGIPVYCTYDEIVQIEDVRPNPINPNHHPHEQILALGGIIRKAGWRNNITVSTRSGLIVKGHGRLLAAQLEELAEVPVEYQHYASEADELADLTADNRIAELAETDRAKLAEVFARIDTGEIDFSQSGYTEEEYEELATAISDAVHEELDDEDAVIEQPTEPVTKYGDIWILGDDRQVTLELRNTLLEDLLPSFVDGVVKAYIRATGSTNVKCIRNGEELPCEAIADIFNE